MATEDRLSWGQVFEGHLMLDREGVRRTSMDPLTPKIQDILSPRPQGALGHAWSDTQPLLPTGMPLLHRVEPSWTDEHVGSFLSTYTSSVSDMLAASF